MQTASTIIQCPECGAKNRIDERAARLQPKCGQCGAKLDVTASSTPGDGKPIIVTDDTLGQVLRGAGSKPVLIDAWAPWCGPCRSIAPIIDQLAAESNGRYVVGKLDVDENPRTAQRYNISGIPTLLVFKNSALVETLVGGRPKAQLAAVLEQHL
jgi:thioredoxin